MLLFFFFFCHSSRLRTWSIRQRKLTQWNFMESDDDDNVKDNDNSYESTLLIAADILI